MNDFGAFPRAILAPASQSARFSILQPENTSRVWLRDINEKMEEMVPKSMPDPMVRLNQHYDEHRFQLGSAINSFIVLKNDPTFEGDTNYINGSHCQIYPAPDSSVWIKNPSLCVQTVIRLDNITSSTYTYSVSIETQACTQLKPGTWLLLLAPGLHFYLHVLCRPEGGLQKHAIQELYDRVSKIIRVNDSSSVRSKIATVIKRNQQLMTREQQGDSKRKMDAAKDDQRNRTNTHTSTTETKFTSKDSLEPAHTDQIINITKMSVIRQGTRRGIAVTIKSIRREEFPNAADLWRNEVNILKMLGYHPNLVEFVDSDARQLEFTYKRIEGRSLEKFTSDDSFSTLTPSDCSTISLQICEALVYLHDRSIIHGDMKPHNIIWNSDNHHATLIDFGISYQVTPDNFRGSGTPCYVAPEFIRRQKTVLSDIYAFGIVLAFARKIIPLPKRYWTLRRIWDNEHTMCQMREWITEIEGLRTVMPHPLPLMLERNPKKRIRSQDLVKALRELPAHISYTVAI